ncbi:hypothetical protein H0H93_015448 [Arthromyces matolae]|nr:hypothetical protein H0H93_015448 [Arthromyces matolae]
MSNNTAKVSATDDGIPVSDTLALLLQALNTGASITINLPPGTFPPGALAVGNTNVQSSVPVGNSSSDASGATPASVGPNVASAGVPTVSSGVTTAPAPTGGNVGPSAPPIISTSSNVAPAATSAPVANAPAVSASAVPVPVPVPNVASTPSITAAPGGASTNSTGGNTAPAPPPAPVGIGATPTVPAVAPPAPVGAANPGAPEPLEPMDPAAIAAGAQGNDLQEDIHVRFYCVTVGRRIGIFAGWGNTAPHVTGASGSCYTAIDKGRGARNRAMRAFNDAFAAGNYNIVP